MKKTVLLCLLLYHIITANSQSDTFSFKERWDGLFVNFMGLTAAPTGYLWDKAIPDSSLWFFTGKKEDSIAEYEHWSNAYQYWINASNSRYNIDIPYDTVRNKLNALFKQGVIAVPLLNGRANCIKPSAFNNGAITMDSSTGALKLNTYLDVFEFRQTVVAAPYVQVVFNPHVKLYVGNDLYFTNTRTKLQKVRIQLNQGVFEDIPIGLVKELLLTLSGVNLLTIEYTLDNEEILYARSVLVNSGSENGGGTGNHSESNPFHFGDDHGNIYVKPIRETETKEPLGAFIDYIPGRTNGTQNTCIKKPIIFVEGIDFGYKDHPTGCYGGKCGNLGLKDLRNGNLYNPYQTKSKNWYEKWNAIEKAPILISELEKRGYDMFYLDFHNGADYMENNAMLLVELIKQINSRKCSNEEIVIIGASMGGQIAKYALSYMEKNQIPHCTRTYLSFDSPHQGANIPLGLQYQLQYYKGKLPGVKDMYDRKISRVATQQLLLYHCMSGKQAAPHGLRKDFVDALYALGNYPLLTRNIALINGSITGGDQGYVSGDRLLSMNPYGGKALYDFLRISSTVFACYSMDEGVPVVSEASFPLKKKSVNKVPPQTIAYDQIPGAKRFDLRDSRAIYLLFNVINHHDASCFIPSVSGLDINTKNLYFNPLVNIKKTIPDQSIYPFHTYFGPTDENEEHVMITDDNIRWMVEEIEKNRIELPVALDKVYNYGQYERFMFRNTTIVAGGKLQFNGDYNTGFGQGLYDAKPNGGIMFESYTTDCSPLITIDAGGQLTVGDNNPGNNKAIVHFRKGSTLAVKSGGTLTIHNNSQLMIEEGAKLIVYPGAKIILDGDGAMLQVDGVLKLEADAVLSVEKGSTGHTGFIKFRNVGGGYGHASIEVVGNNTSINLEGTDKTTDLLLQIEGEMLLPDISPAWRLRELKLNNCKVSYGNNSRIKTKASLNIQQVKFENLNWVVPNVSDALWVENPDNFYISGCTFSYLNYGVKCSSGNSINNLTIEHSVFEYCKTGFYGSGRGVNLTASKFDHCFEKGFYLQAPSNDSRIFECQFTHNLTGLEVDNSNLVSRYVFINNSSFYYNQLGLDVKQCVSSVSCSRFLNNSIGVSAINGEFNISRNKIHTGNLYTAAGGNNTFAYNAKGLKLSGLVFYLNEGYNNFIQQSGLAAYNFVTGDITYNVFTHQAGSPYPLMASNNYWQPAPSTSLMNGIMTHYFVMFPFPGTGPTVNYFTGAMLKGTNTMCFKPACNPCDKIQNQIPVMDTGLLYKASEMAKISPYPVQNQLNLELLKTKDEGIFYIRLLSMDGKVLYEITSSAEFLTIESANYADGIYLLELSSKNRHEIKRIIIKR